MITSAIFSPRLPRLRRKACGHLWLAIATIVLPQTFPRLATGQSSESVAPFDSPTVAFAAEPDASAFRTARFDGDSLDLLENNFNSFPDFDGGIVVFGESAAMKIGGFVKADFISDFDPIESQDSFDTTQIPVDASDYRNLRFHAKQSRLSFDTRWRVNGEIARAYVETDFFGGDDGGNGSLRLRHAYGTIGRLTAGQTWSTFTDPSAVPQTIDVEGAVSNVNRRQGLIRLDLPLGDSGWSCAIALEDPNLNVEIPIGVVGQGRTESPDIITRIRLDQDWGETQTAFVYRRLGFQPDGGRVITVDAWGVNLTGSIRLTEHTRVYSQITLGEGIGSYRGAADVVATGSTTAALLPTFGWMVGCKQQWSRRLTSNATFSQLTNDDLSGQPPTNLRQTEYLAINLVFNPYERVFAGVEYLHGVRENINRERADANRLQFACGFYLP